VPAIAGIGDAAIEDVADERLLLRNDRAERVPVLGIAGQCCRGDKLPAGGVLHRGGDALFDTEFVRPVRFALADALDLWRVQGIDLAAALGALLLQCSSTRRARNSGPMNASRRSSFPAIRRSMSTDANLLNLACVNPLWRSGAVYYGMDVAAETGKLTRNNATEADRRLTSRSVHRLHTWRPPWVAVSLVTSAQKSESLTHAAG
jgi:hypothetical protein